MKKYFTKFYLLLVIIPLTFLCACNKSELKDQLNPAAGADAANLNRCCCCPSTVATATGISYSMTFDDPQRARIGVDLFYTNAEAAGTFHIILKNRDGNVEFSGFMPAEITGTQSQMMHMDFLVSNSSFPCTLQVNGRPANLDCGMRSRMRFDILNDVSRTN